MEFKKIFTDKESEGLYKQIREAQEYISEKLEKHISRELVLRVLEKNLLPVLVYPEKRQEGVLPMWYSSGSKQIDIHTPKPDVKLLTLEEWCTVPKMIDRHRYPDLEEWRTEQEKIFYETLNSMIEAVKKIES